MNEGPKKERPRPARVQALIDEATRRASVQIAKQVIASMADRGGNAGDVMGLLGHINAMVLATLLAEDPAASAKIDELIDMFAQNAKATAQRARTITMLKRG